jgi:hypothetical protein
MNLSLDYTLFRGHECEKNICERLLFFFESRRTYLADYSIDGGNFPRPGRNATPGVIAMNAAATQVLPDGDVHGKAGVLHPDEPTVERKQRQHGRGRPDTDAEIGDSQRPDGIGGGNDEVRHPLDGTLQKEDADTAHHGYQQGDAEHPTLRLDMSLPEGLSGESAGAHAQEIEEPIDHIEYQATHGNSSDGCGRPYMPRDGNIDHTQQGHGDIRDDAGYGYMEDFAVHNSISRIDREVKRN